MFTLTTLGLLQAGARLFLVFIVRGLHLCSFKFGPRDRTHIAPPDRMQKQLANLVVLTCQDAAGCL